MDDQWLRLIRSQSSVPEALAAKRRDLLTRATEITEPSTIDEVDVVIGGSGFMALYYLGVHTVLQAAQIRIVRHAGASSGAMMAMELRVLGLEHVVDLYLAYGKLQSENAASTVVSAWRADRHWKMWAAALFEEEAALAAINDTVHTSVTRLTWRGLVNVVYSDYPTLELVRSVYYATGTGLTCCDGYVCTDGGVTNGVPLFSDRVRAQFVVRPTKCGLPVEKVAKFDHHDVESFVRIGQDDAIAFLSYLASAEAHQTSFTNASGSLSYHKKGFLPVKP